MVPLFPRGVTYLPYTKPVLNIFEPRYRAMYNDILFSGARRFMVCNVDGATGRLRRYFLHLWSANSTENNTPSARL